MKRIIIPTDFSDNALNAINYALSLYKKEHCKFYLLNTYTPIIYSYDYQMNTGGYLGEITDVVRENSLKKLQTIKDDVTSNFNNTKHEITIVSSFNLLTDEIKDLVETKDIDLIIMGTKGATRAKEVLFGTNTIHIINKVKCPVLAIPDGYFFEEPTEVLFPTDYKIDYTDKHLEILNFILKLFKSRVHVLHVSHGVDLSKGQTKNKDTLESLLANAKDAFYRVEDQEIPKAIHEFQKTTYVHLLMMINNKHSFFENLFFRPVINRIGFHLDIPFLVIPAVV